MKLRSTDDIYTWVVRYNSAEVSKIGLEYWNWMKKYWQYLTQYSFSIQFQYPIHVAILVMSVTPMSKQIGYQAVLTDKKRYPSLVPVQSLSRVWNFSCPDWYLDFVWTRSKLDSSLDWVWTKFRFCFWNWKNRKF